MNLLERRRMMMAAGGGSDEPDYLRFTSLEDNSSVSLNETGTPPTLNLEYRVNGGTWTAYTYGTAISLDTDDYMDMRNADDTVRTQVSSSTGNKNRQFVISGEINASGNIMSLLDKTCKSVTVGNYCFYGLFKNCVSLKTPPILPFINLGTYCCQAMFHSSGIVYAPQLPATTLVSGCYSDMFTTCSNLLVATYMPATILASSCYKNIYRGTSITNVAFATLNDSMYLFLTTSTLQYIIVEDSNPPSIGTNTLYGAPSSMVIYVPDDSVNAYKAANYWSTRAEYIKGISEKP